MQVQRLTPELLASASQYSNALRERELGLRGESLAELENLGATRDAFDALDVCDNLLEALGVPALPRLVRLRTVLAANNRIATIAEDIGTSLPFLTMLVLTNNQVASLREVAHIASLQHLEVLSLAGNPIARDPAYRLFAIHAMPQLRQLDFRKVSQQERHAASDIYGKPGSSSAAWEQAMADQEARMLDNQPTPLAVSTRASTNAEVAQIQEAIKNAKSLDEIKRLQAQLESGGSLAKPA